MADQGRLKSDATEQLRELTEMALRGRFSIINIGPIMLIWRTALIIAALAKRLSQHSVDTVAAWIVPVLLAYRSDQRNCDGQGRCGCQPRVGIDTA